ncbi:MAG: M3 family metallopeptidase [Vampirovibrionales bacterium]|nr:M3 family metallopeptidase [Vampirovibrionales bacterium]
MSQNISTAADFIERLEKAFADSNRDFARAYYLFATAKLSETYNSEEIYQRYPLLSDEQTFHQIKAAYDESTSENPGHEKLTRLFASVLGTYIGKQLAAQSDEFQNLKNQLRIDVADLGLKDLQDSSKPVESILYEDVSQWLKSISDKSLRQKLYERMAKAYTKELSPRFIDLFQQENELLKQLGYADVIGFYSQTSGHKLKQLGERGRELVEKTQALYTERMSAYYLERTGVEFSKATRADIAYVMNRPSEAMAHIDARFPQERLLPLASKTFDQLGLSFSSIAETVDYQDTAAYDGAVVKQSDASRRRILLDISNRKGKRSRAYVYPAQVPSEIYLSVKPEGGLDDYSAFFHESGHALHFAYEAPSLGFALALMGNNTVTETYAYLMQNLFLNRHWLTHEAGLTPEEALLVVKRGALNDLYMLRRYASKMQFELALYDNVNGPSYRLDDKGEVYAGLLTKGCGFVYDAEGWTRDVDAGFYVADYFTAWTLESQLRQYLMKNFGNAENHLEDWYLNPKAGEFLKGLWREGNLNQQDFAKRLGSQDPNDLKALIELMDYNLGVS